MADDASAPLSMDAGLALLADMPHAGPEREPEEAQAATDAPQEASESPEADAETAPEETPAGEEGDAEQPEPEKAPAVAAPHNWDAAAKEKFASLDRETQEFLVQQYEAGERTVGRKLEEASAARKAAEAETANVLKLKTQLDELIPAVSQRFADKWSNATPENWAAWAKQDPEAAFQAKAEYDADMAQMQRLEAARQDATKTAHKTFVDAQIPEMAKIIPGLAKPETAQPYMDKMIGYAREQGATDEQLNWASAKEWALIDKARLWDESQAKLAAKPPQKPVAAAPVRPAAAQAITAPSQRKVQDLSASLRKTGSMSDALALIDAQGL